MYTMNKCIVKDEENKIGLKPSEMESTVSIRYIGRWSMY